MFTIRSLLLTTSLLSHVRLIDTQTPGKQTTTGRNPTTSSIQKASSTQKLDINEDLKEKIKAYGKRFLAFNSVNDEPKTVISSDASWNMFFGNNNKNDKLRKKRNKLERKVPRNKKRSVFKHNDVPSTSNIVAQFRKLFQQQPNSRGVRATSQQMGSPSRNQVSSSHVTDVTSGFSLMTASSEKLKRKQKMELRGFQSKHMGSFIRGSGFNVKSGRFTASFTGVYTFSATVQLALPREALHFVRKDYVSVRICINGKCQINASLDSIVGLEGQGRVFTTTAHGTLQLRRGDYVSVFVRNNSPKHTIAVSRHSYFTGYLLGY